MVDVKVLYLLRYYPCLSETFVRDEVRALEARGVDITIASLGSRADARLVPADAQPAARVWTIPRRGLDRLRPWRTVSAGEQFLRSCQRPKDAARLPWLRARVAAAAFDRVHVHFAGEAAELAHALWLDLQVPYTVTVHAVDLFRPRPSLATVLRHAEAVITISEHHRRYLADQGLTAHVVRCGPELSRWASLPPPPPGPVRALLVARDVPKKGIDTLLSAWPPGDAHAHLHLLSDHSGPLPERCTRAPLAPPVVVQQAMAACNVVVLPCRIAVDGDRDGVPMVLMEAVAAGRPVLSCPVAGVPELVCPPGAAPCGWLVPSDDPLALRRAFDAMTPAARDAHSPGPRHLQQLGFSLDAQANGLLQVWHSAGAVPLSEKRRELCPH